MGKSESSPLTPENPVLHWGKAARLPHNREDDMSCSVKELREFLSALREDDEIGIDEGGLTLIVPATDEDDPEKCEDFDGVSAISYFEIGGVEADGDDHNEHPGGKTDLYHIECGGVPGCQCDTYPFPCSAGSKETVDVYCEGSKERGLKNARVVKGPCPKAK